MSLPLWTCLWFILRCASKSELINISIHNIYFITVRVSFRFIISNTFSYIIFAMSSIVKCLFLYFLRRTNQQKIDKNFRWIGIRLKGSKSDLKEILAQKWVGFLRRNFLKSGMTGFLFSMYFLRSCPNNIDLLYGHYLLGQFLSLCFFVIDFILSFIS